jgi:hypothetical protein
MVGLDQLESTIKDLMEDQNVKEKVKVFDESEKNLNSATWTAGNYSENKGHMSYIETIWTLDS